MHLCEPFLNGAPQAYFGAPWGAPCTPVEEHCSTQLICTYFRQGSLEHRMVGILSLQPTARDKTSAKCGPKTKHNVKYFSNLSSSAMCTIFQSCFLVAILIKLWTDFSKTYSNKVLYLLQSSSIPYTEGYFLFTPHIYGCCSSCTSCSWWIAHSTQRQRRGCNKTTNKYNGEHFQPQ